MTLTPRQAAVQAISTLQPLAPSPDAARRHAAQIYGENVFSLAVMRDVLPKNVYQALLRTIDRGERLDPAHADSIANAMKEWAVARGATHYTHWFQPMTGLTAEKHDSFIVYTPNGAAITEFSGRSLIQGEPDASSFPSGGIRATFEARGYTAWDPTSPAFLYDGVGNRTLYIPTAFCGYNGEALDKKTPLLRSLEALSKQAVRLLRILGNPRAQYVTSTVGPEQEYFLVDRRLHALRPDLTAAGRTLFGARPPKGQELEDHYFGSIRARVLAFMQDVEIECYRLGIPIKTRHNEVAPAQFEFAPIFERANVAADHNMLVMEVMRATANRHGFHCLLHEKPFAGVNGSGKHNNWSMADDQGNNLLEPGQTPEENAHFLVFLTAVIRAVNQWGNVLRVAIASPGNDHRLGANEAPPAIISIFLGEKLTEVVQTLIAGTKSAGKKGGTLEIGAQALPALPRDASDRNRTSPFAFTGNKFEFRAVGSSQTIARPICHVNLIVAESLDVMATAIEARLKAGKNLHDAVQSVVQETLSENQRVIFNGDNYSREWHQEAERRGLPNLRNTVDAAAVFTDPKVGELFAKYGVLTPEELKSRYAVMLENYSKTIGIEAHLTSVIAKQMLLPAGLRHQAEVALSLQRTLEAAKGLKASGAESTLKEIAYLTSRLKETIDELDQARGDADGHHGDMLAHARFCRDRILPAMDEVRSAADAMELVVDDALWPLPKYREMLFLY